MREGRLPSVSELVMPTFLGLSEARLSGKHGVLHISLPRDLSFPRNRVHRCARLICRHIMIINDLLLARGVAEKRRTQKRFGFGRPAGIASHQSTPSELTKPRHALPRI